MLNCFFFSGRSVPRTDEELEAHFQLVVNRDELGKRIAGVSYFSLFLQCIELFSSLSCFCFFGCFGLAHFLLMIDDQKAVVDYAGVSLQLRRTEEYIKQAVNGVHKLNMQVRL